MQDSILTYDDTEVDVELVAPKPQGGARIDVGHPDGRTWRLDVTRTGDVKIVTTWRNGELADLALPEWLTDSLGRLAAPV